MSYTVHHIQDIPGDGVSDLHPLRVANQLLWFQYDYKMGNAQKILSCQQLIFYSIQRNYGFRDLSAYFSHTHLK
ncbi:hypothetical protein N8933_05515, partial [Pseudomonadales bacterium]|nr:hypothetical protein [Pseudomonadales bacterium]